MKITKTGYYETRGGEIAHVHTRYSGHHHFVWGGHIGSLFRMWRTNGHWHHPDKDSPYDLIRYLGKNPPE